MRDHISQEQGEWKGTELSVKIIWKGLHKVFKANLNELKSSLPDLE